MSQFSAVDPALGYLYQSRVSLLYSLDRLRQGASFLVSLEILDDVAFETLEGEPVELLQTKHHKNANAALTDSSSDLWKTLRVWIEQISTNINFDQAALHLLTTEKVNAGSIASNLGIADRDEKAALKLMMGVARTSGNKANKEAYDAFLSIEKEQQELMLRRIVILDGSPNIAEIEERLRSAIYGAARQEHLSAFLERLEGWWFQRVVLQLTSVDESRISSLEIDQKMDDLREQFKLDSLPVDDDLLELDINAQLLEEHRDSDFVKQLNLINVGSRRIASSVRDYYRAFTQRSRWLRNDLVVDMDLSRYERELKEEWSVIFDAMLDDLGEDATEQQRQQSARNVLKWAETVSLPIRPKVSTPFISRGSFHMLADQQEIGWHPEFHSKLASLLQEETLDAAI